LADIDPLAPEAAMSPSRRLTQLAFVALLLATRPLAAQTPDPADLLPFSTLVSIEVRHPEKMAREVLTALKGTAAEDLYHRLGKLRAENPTERVFGGSAESLGIIGMFLSPEFISEIGRFQGAAVALTGFDKDGFPEVVGLIHTGESNLPGFIMRGQLSFERVRLLEEVEKVGIYRQMWFKFFPPGGPQKSGWEASGPYMVNLPGVIAFTSSQESARDVILRYKGKASQPALSSVRAFRDARELRERPGLFMAADIAALTAQLDDAARKLGPIVRTPWNQFKLIVEPRAITRMDGSLTLHDGDLEFLGLAKLNPAFKSPLIELFPRNALKLGSLAGVSDRAWATCTLAVEDAEAQWKTILKVVDALALSLGADETDVPGKQLPAVEKLLGFQIGKDVLGRIEEISFCVDQPRAAPLLILQGRDEAAAKFLQDKALQALFLLASKGKGDVRSEEIKGHALKTYPGNQASGRLGNLVVVGLDAKSVGDQLDRISKKELWSNVEKNSTALKAIGSAEVLLTVTPRTLPLVLGLFDPRAAREYLDAFSGDPRTEDVRDIRLFATTLDQMRPLVFRIVREGDSYKMQSRLDGVRTTVPKLIDTVINQALELERKRRESEKKP
jgi:hypothetical protein